MTGYRASNCTHSAPTRLFKIGRATIYAGSAEELAERAGWAAVVSAVGYTKFTNNPLSGNDAARALFPEALFAWAAPACVGIDWPDGGIPALGAPWWDRLAAALREIDGDVGLCCFGGHGRTGVMASILAVAADAVPKKACPVAWVRKRYCTSAVESSAQVEYVKRITGRKVVVGPSQKSLRAAPRVGAGENPTAAFPAFATGTATGTGTGALDIDASDEVLYEAWFEGPGMALTVHDHGVEVDIQPVWEDQELVGWEPAAATYATDG